MFDRISVGWLLGRPIIGRSGAGWRGTALLGDGAVRLESADRLNAVLSEHHPRLMLLGTTASENLAASLGQAARRAVIPKMVDLGLLVRIAHGGEGQGIQVRTTDVLAELMADLTHGQISPAACRLVLEGKSDGGGGADVVQALRGVMYALLQEVRRKNDFRRYLRYEIPAHRSLLEQSTHRLRIDATGLSTVVSNLDSSQRTRRTRLIAKKSIDPADLFGSSDARARFVERTRGTAEGGAVSRTQLREFVSDRADTDQLCQQLSEYYKSESSRRALAELAAWGTEGCPVVYDSLGSVTGRILMKSPGVQWLEKKYRRFIAAPPDHELRYLDYACFEPTILAVAARDASLLAACRDDLYLRVVDWLGLGGIETRDTAKSLFLRFLYGQSTDRLEEDLAQRGAFPRSDARSRILGLASRIPAAMQFRERIERDVQRTGFLRTACGNRRPAREAEAYKGLSYFLQGTGAIIYKLALSRVFPPGSTGHLVVPMHDAFLCSFPAEGADRSAAEAATSMRFAFSEVMGVDAIRVTTSREF